MSEEGDGKKNHLGGKNSSNFGGNTVARAEAGAKTLSESKSPRAVGSEELVNLGSRGAKKETLPSANSIKERGEDERTGSRAAEKGKTTRPGGKGAREINAGTQFLTGSKKKKGGGFMKRKKRSPPLPRGHTAPKPAYERQGVKALGKEGRSPGLGRGGKEPLGKGLGHGIEKEGKKAIIPIQVKKDAR